MDKIRSNMEIAVAERTRVLKEESTHPKGKVVSINQAKEHQKPTEPSKPREGYSKDGPPGNYSGF